MPVWNKEYVKSEIFGHANFLIGTTKVVGGLFWVYIATEVMHDFSAIWRMVLVFFALGLTYLGLDEICRRIWGNAFETGLWLAVAWVVILILVSIFADFLPLQEAHDTSQTIEREGLIRPDIFSRHPLGTDRQGLDILGGVIYGARVSLQIGIGGVVLGMFLGSSIGVIGGYFGRKIDDFIEIFTNAAVAFPPFILILTLASVLERSPRNMAMALAFISVPTYLQLSRAHTLSFLQKDFVTVSKSLGAKDRRIIFRELLPNVAMPLLSYAFIIIAVLIVAEASLSFLGLGVPRPNPTWGNMIAGGQNSFNAHPHLIFGPGAVMVLTIVSLNRMGDKARQIWDPRGTIIS